MSSSKARPKAPSFSGVPTSKRNREEGLNYIPAAICATSCGDLVTCGISSNEACACESSGCLSLFGCVLLDGVMRPSKWKSESDLVELHQKA